MRLHVRNLDSPLAFDEDRAVTLVVQNRHFFREIFSELAKSQVEKTDGQLLVFDDGVDVGDRMILVSDIFGFNFSSRRLLGELYQRIASDIDNDTLKIIGDIETGLTKIAIFAEDAVDIELEYKTEFDINDLLKLLKIEPSIGRDFDLKQRLYGIIDVVSRLFSDKIICFVNLKQLLAHDEFCEIVKYCLHKKQQTWFLESNDSYSSEMEKIVVVDDDLFCSGL